VPELILASTSAYRRELLGRVLQPFRCEAPGVDETPLPGETAAALVARLARAKAEAVAKLHPSAWVIGSDQAAVLAGGGGNAEIIGKPGTRERCIEQLRRCSGKTLHFLTAVALVRHRDGQSSEFVDTTRVLFRTLDEATIERYVERESPLDCAGGFKSEAAGISLCDSIESLDPTALIGLPLIKLCAALRAVGFALP
jgi:septum formation protein